MMSFETVTSAAFIYLLSVLSLIRYLYYKHRNEQYIFSITNIHLFVYAFTLFIIPLLTFSPVAWVKLLGNTAYATASLYYPYLLKSITINCFGFALFNIFSLHFERSKSRPRRIVRLAKKSNFFVSFFLDLEFFAIVSVWLINNIVIIGGFGIQGVNSNASNGMFHYLNQACNVLITTLTLYYGFCFLNKRRKLLFFLIGLTLCVLTGKRSTLLEDVIWGLIVYLLYRKTKFPRTVFFKAVKYAIILAVVGLFFGIMRSSDDMPLSTLQELIYGNTFCDIRDGGFLLYGFQNNANSQWAYGRTYLSAFLSFIPSSLSVFRMNWDYGRYSTTALLGIKDHPGLRGGWSMEGYLNFGLIGVILVSLIQARLFSSLEVYFRETMFKIFEKGIKEKSIIPIYYNLILARRAICSAGFFSVYVLIVFMSVNFILGQFIKQAKRM